jgi:hypothetical protein
MHRHCQIQRRLDQPEYHQEEGIWLVGEGNRQ